MLMEMVIDGFDVPEDGATQDAVADLIVRVASGDQAAFATLYDMLSSRVFGLILRVLINRAQSEEVLQEVFLRSGNPLPASLRTEVRDERGS